MYTYVHTEILYKPIYICLYTCKDACIYIMCIYVHIYMSAYICINSWANICIHIQAHACLLTNT